MITQHRPRISRAHAAQLIGKSTRTVDTWRKNGWLPPASGGDGRGVSFDADDFDMFAETFGEEFADLFFNFRGIGYFFLGWFHGAVILSTTGAGCKGGFWR